MRINILEPHLRGNEKEYVLDCLNSNWISSKGNYVKALEKSVLRGNSQRNSLVTSNGTVAIHLALVAMGIKTGDEVIVPNITFGATINAVMHTGAKPVIVDIDPSDWNMCRDSIRKAVNKRTKAILPVALFGNPSGIKEITEWAIEKGLICIVDAAEAVGARIEEKDIGSYADAVTYSYFGNKTITTGEGGSVIFKSKSIAEKARILRDHGMSPNQRYRHDVIGFNYRMTNLQAAIGVAQYEQLDQIIKFRKELVDRYKDRLSDLDVIFQAEHVSSSSSYWVFAAQFSSKDIKKIESELSKSEIEFRGCFEPMHLQPAFNKAKIIGNQNISMKIYKNILMLPTHNNLTLEDIDYICEKIRKSVN